MHEGRAAVERDALAACVADGVPVLHADDLRFDEKGLLEGGLGVVAFVAGVVGVHEQEAAGLQLVPQAAGRFEAEGAGAAAGDDGGRQIGLGQRVARGGHAQGSLADRVAALGHGAQVLRAAVVSVQARVAQAGAALQALDQGDGGRAGRNAAAALADVDFNEHVNGGAGGLHGQGKAVNAFVAVHGNGELAAAVFEQLRQASHAAQLGGGDDFVADEDVIDAACGQRLAFAHGLHAHADGARLHLQPRDVGAFVQLGVRAQLDLVLGREFSHALHVAIDGFGIQHEGGGVNGIRFLALQGGKAALVITGCVHQAVPVGQSGKYRPRR